MRVRVGGADVVTFCFVPPLGPNREWKEEGEGEGDECQCGWVLLTWSPFVPSPPSARTPDPLTTKKENQAM